jgi:poly-beta-1,6-N-acetyl-D-glucosamine biosynthesis protein PgaD
MPDIEIRDNPKMRSFLRSITEMSFTGVVWVIWAYLLLPVINIILWLLGFKYFNIAVFEKLGYREFLELMGKVGWLVVIVFLVMRLWGYYNYVRFGKRTRRKSSPPVTIEQLAVHFQIPVEQIENMQAQKETTWENARNSKTF